jgi:flagellar biosynthesis chaperone FliJ
MSKAFRYALEPLRLTRSWTVDELLAELASCNNHVAQQRGALDMLQAELAQLRSDWLAGQATGAPLALGRMALLSRYLQDGTHRQADMQRRLDLLEAERSEKAQQVVTARRALDAVEKHRDGEQLAFRRARANADLGTADDHWNVLHGGEREYDIDR